MNWTRKTVSRAAIAVAALVTGLAAAQAGSLKIESWRNDDADIWNSKIIPAFNKTLSRHQGRVRALRADGIQRRAQRAPRRRHGGRPHHLPSVRRLARSLSRKSTSTASTTSRAWTNFSDVAKAAWTTDDGKTTFCVPMASVIHGFIYNKDAFKKVGATEPKTMAEFHDVLDKLKKDGTYMPIVHGHRRPVGSRDDGLPEHRPQLLEGRGRPRWP